MKNSFLLLIVMAIFMPFAATQGESQEGPMSVYDFTLKDIDGKEAPLSRYKGNVLLMVNVASRCGYTPQYHALEKLYKKHGKDGLVVLGFPANNFGAQEPGNDEEIKNFCSLKYNVTFPLFSKISVKGSGQHPLYKFLTDAKTNPAFPGEITWNFNKFLINRGGVISARFESSDKPESDKVRQAVEDALQKQ